MKCGKGARRSSIAFSKAQHKTDGSHPNRPFSYRKQAAGETNGFHPPPSPAMPFISVLREKESAPFRKDRKPVPLAPNLCYNEASEVNSMARMRLLNALPAGVTQFEGFCIIKSVSVRQNIKGTDYLDLVLADAEGEAVAKLWDYNRAVQGEYQAGDVVKVRGSITIWKDAEQLKIERIRKSTPADNVDMSGLLPCAPCSSSRASGRSGSRSMRMRWISSSRARLKSTPSCRRMLAATPSSSRSSASQKCSALT